MSAAWATVVVVVDVVGRITRSCTVRDRAGDVLCRSSCSLVDVRLGAAQATFDTNEFPSMWDGVWWAVVTVTTIGYGDLYPTDVEGRIIGIALMLLEIGSSRC